MVEPASKKTKKTSNPSASKSSTNPKTPPRHPNRPPPLPKNPPPPKRNPTKAQPHKIAGGPRPPENRKQTSHQSLADAFSATLHAHWPAPVDPLSFGPGFSPGPRPGRLTLAATNCRNAGCRVPGATADRVLLVSATPLATPGATAGLPSSVGGHAKFSLQLGHPFCYRLPMQHSTLNRTDAHPAQNQIDHQPPPVRHPAPKLTFLLRAFKH